MRLGLQSRVTCKLKFVSIELLFATRKDLIEGGPQAGFFGVQWLRSHLAVHIDRKPVTIQIILEAYRESAVFVVSGFCISCICINWPLFISLNLLCGCDFCE